MKPKPDLDRESEQGMTLLELLIVIAILSLLAVLASVQLSGYLSRAKHDTAKLQINELQLALDLFKLDVGRYPLDDEGLGALLSQPQQAAGWRGPYLKSPGAIVDPWDREYRYSRGNSSKDYKLGTYGADGAPGGEGEDEDIGM